MHDLLVSYLLGEATEHERRFIEQRLREDPTVRGQLEHLRRCLGLDEPDGEEPPPADLARRTSQHVATVADSGDFERGDSMSFSSLGFASSPSGPGQAAATTQWTVADLTVATGVALAIGMLLLPALGASHCASQRLHCQNNLCELGFALAKYSEDHNRFMPQVKPGEHTGIYAIRLIRGGYLDHSRIAQLVVCPASKLADDIDAGRVTDWMPTWEKFQASRGLERVRFIRLSGGTYAYRLPYKVGGEFRALRNTHSSKVPILADSPNPQLVEYTSCNHGGCGENVLFQDQNVRYLVGWFAPDGKDDLFLNYRGHVSPSDQRTDTVLAPSEVRPLPISRDKVSRFRIRVVRPNSP